MIDKKETKRREHKLMTLIAIHLHNKYEKHSKRYDWKTQKKCQVKFDDLPDKNKIVMLKVARDVLDLMYSLHSFGYNNVHWYYSITDTIEDLMKENKIKDIENDK